MGQVVSDWLVRPPPVYGQKRTGNERFLPVDRGYTFRAAKSARKPSCTHSQKPARKSFIQKSNDCEAVQPLGCVFLEIETQRYFVELAFTSGKAFPVITKLCFGMEKINATTAEADMRASSP